ncbi:MAG: hypothetical protein JW730_02175 [Anaerolineales bacterium]|nr:hypothetical protein [Anaerolineales bacterium]
MSMKKSLVLLGTLLLLGVILVACGGKPEPTAAPTEPPVPTPPPVEIPYQEQWESSAHNAVDTETFRHWDADDPAEVPISCAKCHSTAGYQDFLGADGSEANKVDAAVPAQEAQGVQCVACHNPVATNLNSVAFPGFETDENGESVPFVVEGFGDSSRCLVCHQGRESKASVDAQIARFQAEDPDTVVAPIKDDQGRDVTFGFRNIHYYAAAATLYGTEVKGGYEYDGKVYDAKFQHVEGRDTCIGCHDPHTLQVKVDECASCHGDEVKAEGGLQNIREPEASAWDYDGDGDSGEGMFYEIEGLQGALLAEIQKYAADTAGAEITYDPAHHPYFLGTDGKAYAKWTPRLLKAAYNYQVSVKDPGAFAHGNKYIVQLLYDSIEDLGGDVTNFVRNDAGHFAGNTEAFRHWDAEGEVPGSCAKCHSATGLPQFLKEGATISNETANGFLCSTCHDEANWPNRYEVASATFPSGATISFGGRDAEGNFVPNDGNLCLECHQGRSSKPTVDRAIASSGAADDDAPAAEGKRLSFSNVHYFAAGATLFGADAQGAYMYDGKEYAGYYEQHPLNKCQDCHDVHALEPNVEACAGCHPGVEVEQIRMNAPDYDGDGDTTEGVKGELDGLAEALLAEIQAYAEAQGAAITYDSHTYPYFLDANGKGYAAWTPRLLKAAYNYQYYQKDPGAFVHNPAFVAQFLIDSIEDLGGDVSKYTRPEVAAEAPAQ